MQLEEHIRIIALSGDWVKLVDGMLDESLMIQSSTCTIGTTQKRGLSGRRNRKQSAVSEVTADGCRDQSFEWWRGGKLSKIIFQRAILPRSLVRKAARQGNYDALAFHFLKNSLTTSPLIVSILPPPPPPPISF